MRAQTTEKYRFDNGKVSRRRLHLRRAGTNKTYCGLLISQHQKPVSLLEPGDFHCLSCLGAK